MKKPFRSICNKKFVLSLSLITALSACGGGGGGGKTDNNSSISKPVSSSVNTLSSAANTISSTTNSSIASSKVMSPMSIAASSSSSITFEPGAKPDAFSFTAITEAKANTTVTSNTITVTGITKAISISITGGEYSIDSGTYTSSAGTISNNQTVSVRVKSAAASKTLNSAVLNLGGLTGSFNVTTLEDSTAPTAQIMFPTPVSLTEGTSILVRGVASDNANEIENLTVNGVAATTSDGYANWQAEVPLNSGANELMVNVTDAAGNNASNAATANIKSGSLAENRTSSTENVIEDPVGIVLDLARNRAIVMDRADHFYLSLLGVDLATGNQTVLTQYWVADNTFAGVVLDEQNNRVLMQNAYSTYAFDLTNLERTRFSTDNTGNEANPFDFPEGIALDKANARALVTEYGQVVLSVNLATGARTIFSSNTVPNSTNAFDHPESIVVDSSNNRALVANKDYDEVNSSILAINLTTGVRSILSNNTTPNSNNKLSRPNFITLDTNRDRALVGDDDGTILAVDLTTGARSILSSGGQPDAFNKFSTINSMAVDETRNIALVAPYESGAIYALDLITGKRVIFSK